MSARRMLIAGGATLAAVLLLAACGTDRQTAAGGGGQEPVKKQVRVAVFLASAANSYSQAQIQGAQDAAKQLGAAITSFDAQFDVTRQYRELQDAVTSKRFDAFVISGNDGNALVPQIKEAIGQGIKVACILAPCGPDLTSLSPQVPGQVTHVGTSFPNNGRAIATLVVKACEGKNPCKVAYLPGLPNVPYEKARLDGFKEVLAQNPSIKLVAVQGGGYLAEPALKATQNILQANPDLNVIASSGDQMIVGAETAVKNAGRTGKVVLVGNGASREGVKAVQEGRWFGSAVYLPYSEGKIGTEMVIKAVRGEPGVTPSVNTDTLTPVGNVVTQDNAAGFKPEWRA